MDRLVLQKHSLYSGISNFDFDVVVDEPFVLSDSDIDRVIRQIFSVNKKTGLPNGDLAYFLSSDGNPQIKEWLINNLLKPRVTSKNSLEGVTDDMIEEFSRKNGESLTAYASRLSSLREDAINTSKSD